MTTEWQIFLACLAIFWIVLPIALLILRNPERSLLTLGIVAPGKENFDKLLDKRNSDIGREDATAPVVSGPWAKKLKRAEESRNKTFAELENARTKLMNSKVQLESNSSSAKSQKHSKKQVRIVRELESKLEKETANVQECLRHVLSEDGGPVLFDDLSKGFLELASVSQDTIERTRATIESIEHTVVAKEKALLRSRSQTTLVYQHRFHAVSEKYAAQVLSKELANFPPTDTVDKSVSEEEKLRRAFDESINRSISVWTVISSKLPSFYPLNPTVDAALKRLLKDLEEAQVAAKRSGDGEEKLEQNILELKTELDAIGVPAGHEDSRVDAAESEIIKSRQSSIRTSIDVLEFALRDSRRQNAFALDKLFYAESIVCRLQVCNLLLGICPTSSGGEALLRAFEEVLELFSKQFKKNSVSENNTFENELNDANIHEKVSSLEHRLKVLLLGFAKSDLALFSQKDRELLKAKADSLVPELVLARDNQRKKLEHWMSFSEYAKSEQKKFLCEVTEARAEYCKGIVVTITQSLEILGYLVDAQK